LRGTLGLPRFAIVLGARTLVVAVALLVCGLPAGAHAQCFNCGPDDDLEVSDNYFQAPLLAADGSEQKVDLRVRNNGPNDAEHPVLSFQISSSSVQVRRVVDDANLTTGSATTLSCGPGGGFTAVCSGAPTIQKGDTHLIHLYLSSTTSETVSVTLTATADQNDVNHANDSHTRQVEFDASCQSRPNGDVVCGGGGGGGGGGGDPGGGGGTQQPDTTAPSLTSAAAKAPKLAAVIAKGLKIKASCSEACTLKLTLTVAAGSARKLGLGKKKATIGSGEGSLKAAGSTRATVKLTSKAKRKLKGARSVKATLTTSAKDGAGNAAKPKRQTVTLKR
jgi:hypothetical protein